MAHDIDFDKNWLEDALEDSLEDEVEEDEKSDDSEFNFSEFYEDDNENEEENNESIAEQNGIIYDEAQYDEILKLDSEETSIAVEAEYPYIRVSGFLISDEVVFMQNTLEEYKKSISGRYSENDMINIVLRIKNSDYIVNKLPLVLDTFLYLFKAHKYDVYIVRDENTESKVTSDLMKAFMFT